MRKYPGLCVTAGGILIGVIFAIIGSKTLYILKKSNKLNVRSNQHAGMNPFLKEPETANMDTSAYSNRGLDPREHLQVLLLAREHGKDSLSNAVVNTWEADTESLSIYCPQDSFEQGILPPTYPRMSHRIFPIPELLAENAMSLEHLLLAMKNVCGTTLDNYYWHVFTEDIFYVRIHNLENLLDKLDSSITVLTGELFIAHRIRLQAICPHLRNDHIIHEVDYRKLLWSKALRKFLLQTLGRPLSLMSEEEAELQLIPPAFDVLSNYVRSFENAHLIGPVTHKSQLMSLNQIDKLYKYSHLLKTFEALYSESSSLESGDVAN